MNIGGDDENNLRRTAEVAKRVTAVAHAAVAQALGGVFLVSFHLARVACFVGLIAMLWMFAFRGFSGTLPDLAVVTLGATWVVGNAYGVVMARKYVVSYAIRSVETGNEEGFDLAAASMAIALTKTSQVFFLGVFAATVLVVASLFR